MFITYMIVRIWCSVNLKSHFYYSIPLEYWKIWKDLENLDKIALIVIRVLKTLTLYGHSDRTAKLLALFEGSPVGHRDNPN